MYPTSLFSRNLIARGKTTSVLAPEFPEISTCLDRNSVNVIRTERNGIKFNIVYLFLSPNFPNKVQNEKRNLIMRVIISRV